jgi:hypothetical protein
VGQAPPYELISVHPRSSAVPFALCPPCLCGEKCFSVVRVPRLCEGKIGRLDSSRCHEWWAQPTLRLRRAFSLSASLREPWFFYLCPFLPWPGRLSPSGCYAAGCAGRRLRARGLGLVVPAGCAGDIVQLPGPLRMVRTSRHQQLTGLQDRHGGSGGGRGGYSMRVVRALSPIFW